MEGFNNNNSFCLIYENSYNGRYSVSLNFVTNEWRVVMVGDNETVYCSTFNSEATIEYIRQCLNIMQTNERVPLDSCENCFINYICGVYVARSWG